MKTTLALILTVLALWQGIIWLAQMPPFLLPSPHEPPRSHLYAIFSALMAAQVELDEFDSRSADAFSFDDSIRFVLRETGLEIKRSIPRTGCAGGAGLTSLGFVS